MCKLGVIAGGGAGPRRLIEVVQGMGREVFVLAFEGFTESETVEGVVHLWSELGQIEEQFEWMRSKGVEEVVMIGSIRRPGLSELRLDRKARALLLKYGLRVFVGDAKLLSFLRDVLEEENFRIRGIHEFIEEMLVPSGVLGTHEPSKEDYEDITRGVEVSRTLGALDVGQAVVVQQNVVLGVEAIEGTDLLLERCKELQRFGKGGVLVKMSKPQQDLRLDMPSIGTATVKRVAEAGMTGIALQARHCLILERREKVLSMADEYGLFIVGIEIDH